MVESVIKSGLDEIYTNLKPVDRERVIDFARVLLEGEKQQELKREIEERREEVRRGEVLTSEEMWDEL